MMHMKQTLMVACLMSLVVLPAPAASEDGQDARIARLIEQLGDRKFRVREDATKQLTAIGKPAVPALRAVLESPDPDIRLRARLILNKIESGIPYLIGALGDRDAKVRKDAAVQLGRIGTPAKEAAPALVRALKDPDQTVRDAALNALQAVDPQNKALAGVIPARASVNGKYAKLLRKIKVEQDRQNYTEFRDFGKYQACDYAGYTGIPEGFWVYVYPHWYIWGEQKRP
jgi:HEAT repeats